MKKISLFLMICCILFSCQSEEEIVNTAKDTGYLRLAVSTVASTTTKTGVPENYNPKQLYVEILDASGKVVESTDDFSTDWTGKQFELKAGTYTIKASSNGFDGSVADFDIPYYAGETTVTVVKDKEVTASVVCKLANVKVTVNFDSSFSKAFKSAEASVSSFLEGVSPLSFTMGVEKGAAYFPEGNLIATIRVVNFDGGAFVQRDTIKNVKANDHYILNYQVKLEGEGDIKIEVDETERVYSITFGVNPNPTTTLEVDYPEVYNLWSTFAHVTGKVATKENESDTFDSSLMFFEYKQASEDDWEQVLVTDNGDETYKGTLKNLTPNTAYSYRLAYRAGSEEYISGEKVFTTDGQPLVPNLSFDDWNDKEGYPSPNASGASTYWDTGNPGADSAGETPTESESTDVVKGKAVKMHSEWVNMFIVTTFAAGNIYTGSFKEAIVNLANPGAKLNFGQPFKGRPSQLKGYYKYKPGTVNHVDKTDAIKEGEPDQCAIYIALLDWTAPFEVNTTTSTFVDFTSSSVIAYGQLTDNSEYPVNQTMSSYKEFTIDLKYRDLTRKPTYILIVASASKYGDYFTGSDSSVLLIDEFSLEYGEPVIDTNYITESK